MSRMSDLHADLTTLLETLGMEGLSESVLVAVAAEHNVDYDWLCDQLADLAEPL